jgi:hypothetical protein
MHHETPEHNWDTLEIPWEDAGEEDWTITFEGGEDEEEE